MNLKHDNVFYRLFSSIRYDWSYCVDERVDWMLEVLPYTSVSNKTEMKEELIAMKKVFLREEEREPSHFDGREWVMQTNLDYRFPAKWIKIDDIDLDSLSNSEKVGPYLNDEDDDCNCHECVEVFYEAWKKEVIKHV
jgi:hypothetical protein